MTWARWTIACSAGFALAALVMTWTAPAGGGPRAQTGFAQTGFAQTGLAQTGTAQTGSAPVDPDKARKQEALREALKSYPYRIVHETNRNKKRELHVMTAAGAAVANLSKDAKDREFYPHCTADGAKICFVSDQTEGGLKSRNVYYMNADGTGRTLVARNARDPCWNHEGTVIAYTPGEFDKWTDTDYASKGMCFYDLKTGQIRPHANKDLHHLYVICWSPDDKWMLAAVHGGMGYDHALLAIDVEGTKVYQLKGINGCRPDFRPDGKRIAWNRTDEEIGLADIEFGADGPRISNVRNVITCDKKHMVYHADWSPEGKYIAFDYGPSAEGAKAGIRGWDVCVADAAATDVWIKVTQDGASNMEPDWIPGGLKKDP
jgi:Tol biopolymer transport system component